MKQKTQPPKKVQRVFVRADIEAWYKKHMDLEDDEIVAVRFLPEIQRPTWLVRTRSSSGLYFTSLIEQEESDVRGPWLTFVSEVDLPEGFATPAEEDAEVERLEQVRREEWARKMAGMVHVQPSEEKSDE